MSSTGEMYYDEIGVSFEEAVDLLEKDDSEEEREIIYSRETDISELDPPRDRSGGGVFNNRSKIGESYELVLNYLDVEKDNTNQASTPMMRNRSLKWYQEHFFNDETGELSGKKKEIVEKLDRSYEFSEEDFSGKNLPNSQKLTQRFGYVMKFLEKLDIVETWREKEERPNISSNWRYQIGELEEQEIEDTRQLMSDLGDRYNW
ncbi:MAG: hypothetical protein ABEJ95_04600 [Candidatus Nanohalobium sp.]